MICLTRINPMKTSKCSTWLEIYGSLLSGGQRERIFFYLVRRQIFGDASEQTSALILTVCIISLGCPAYAKYLPSNLDQPGKHLITLPTHPC